MAFKAKDFDKAKFSPRTTDVPVPGLSEWFDGRKIDRRKMMAAKLP